VASYNYKTDLLAVLNNESVNGIKVVATVEILNNQRIDQFDKILAGKMIDEVLFLLEPKDMTYLEEYIICCETMGISANVVATFYDLPKSSIHVGRLGGIPVLKYATTPQSQSNLLIKRAIDIIGALIGMGITFVVSIFLVPIILIDSKGPVIFKQTRIGKNGRPFILYKFRSMCSEAEHLKGALLGENQMRGAMFKIEKDPRITKVGKFIRKTSLDELPQFWNVLQGDMSLVGTRPPLPEEVEKYKRHHWKRLSMKPGITGIWQTSGRNKVMDFEVIAQMDATYIDQWSLRLDLKLLFKTVKVVFNGQGAS
jgi:exopolysaccharide biosynthesis polyprenyl glycosylphosphotransferase